MHWPAALAALAALGFWVGALVSALAMLRHRNPSRTIAWYLVNGWAFFDRRHFLPTAAPHRRHLARCAAGFAVCIVAVALLGALAV